MDVMLSVICANFSCAIDPSKNFYSNFKPILTEREELDYLGRQLRGQHFRIATVQSWPLSYAIQENGRWVGKGFAFDFISYLQEKFHFTYSVTVPKEDVLGYNQTGIFGMVYKGEADLAAAFLPVFSTYWSLIRYSPTLDSGEWVALMKRPRESATGSGLLAPFTFDTWIMTLIFVIFVGPVFYVIIKFHRKALNGENKTTANLYGCVWFVYGALLKQGTVITPVSDSVRLLFATWWIFITILTAFYTANLTAFLTLSQFTLPIREARDIGSGRYYWVTKTGNAIEHAAKEDLEASFKGSRAHYTTDNNDVILQTYVKKKNYIYLGDKPIVEHMMYQDYLAKARADIAENERCTFVITTWAVLERGRAFIYNKNFAHGKIFDDTLQRLVESGVIKYKLREGLPKTMICPLNLKSKERKLRNTDLILTYYIVGGGYLFAAFIFFMENVLRCILRPKPPSGDVKGKDLPIMPPAYHTLFGTPFNSENGEKKTINGREYWVVHSDKGESNLVPIRTPSALLFQYTN